MLRLPPSLHIYIAQQHLVVPDDVRGFYLGSDAERVAVAVQQGPDFSAIQVERMDAPLGFTFQRTPNAEWNVAADPGIEGILCDTAGQQRPLHAPEQTAGGLLQGVQHLAAGLNLIIVGTEELQLFVPPVDAITLSGGNMLNIAKERQQPSWHPETIRRRHVAAQEHYFERQEQSREELNAALRKKIAATSKLQTPAEVDKHNLQELRRLSQKLSKEVVMMHSLKAASEGSIDAYFHPVNGALILFSSKQNIASPWLQTAAHAQLQYTYPDFRPLGIHWPEGETPEISAGAAEALARLPRLWQDR